MYFCRPSNFSDISFCRRSVTSRDDVNDAGKRAMASGTKLMIFPEGTRS